MSHDQISAAEKLNGIQQEEQQRLIRVPIATFPPTAIMYSLDQNAKRQEQQQQQQQQNDNDNKGYVPMSLIARVLTQADQRKSLPRSFLCIKCKKDVNYLDKGCQVDLLPSLSSYDLKVSSRTGGPHVFKKHQSLDEKHLYNSTYNNSSAEESFHCVDYQRKREHCLSSSSTETEI